MNKGPILAELRQLRELKRLASLRRGDVLTSRLESEFLEISSNCEPGVLEVKKPSLYSLHDSEKDHVRDALKMFGAQTTPEKIDAIGRFEGSPEDLIMILSPGQIDADFMDERTSFVVPLLREIFMGGYDLIHGFALHEALTGRLNISRGTLKIADIPIFPQQFTPGPYEISVKLDTPHNTVQRYADLIQTLDELIAEPKITLLNPDTFSRIASEANSLKAKLGPLGRYNVPDGNEFSTHVNSLFIAGDKAELFYFYSLIKNKNILVYYGENPYETSPKDLVTVNGTDYENTLSSLLYAGLIDVSSEVLDSRIENLVEVQVEASRRSRQALQVSQHNYNAFIKQLERFSQELKQLHNPDIRRNWASRLEPGVVEYMLYPNSEDHVLQSIIPRLSWDTVIREYHNTQKFKESFEESEEQEKKIKEVVQHMRFANQQNNAVNTWLYDNHRDVCESAGVSFRLN